MADEKETPVTETEMALHLADRFVTALELIAAEFAGRRNSQEIVDQEFKEFAESKQHEVEQYAKAFACLAAGGSFHAAAQKSGIEVKLLIDAWEKQDQGTLDLQEGPKNTNSHYEDPKHFQRDPGDETNHYEAEPG